MTSFKNRAFTQIKPFLYFPKNFQFFKEEMFLQSLEKSSIQPEETDFPSKGNIYSKRKKELHVA